MVIGLVYSLIWYGGFMKKILGLTAVLFMAAAIETFAIGLGVQFGGNVRGAFDAPGVSLLLSTKEDTHGAITWYARGSGLSLGGSADYWFLPIEITSLGSGELKFFLGGGLFAWLWMWDDYFGLGAGVRVPFGLDWKMEKFDVFLQAVPQVGLAVLPSLGFGDFEVDVNLGFRFWF
jgi:hypothetical protein